jgi:hypothetical protein
MHQHTPTYTDGSSLPGLGCSRFVSAAQDSYFPYIFGLMPRLRRFAPLLFLPLVFQLALAAKAVACVNQPASTSAKASTNMPGMDMSGTQTLRDDVDSQHSRQPPCNRPFGFGDCQPLAGCASGVLAPTQSASNDVAGAAHSVAILIMLAPPSRSTPPELPPPRA